MWGWVWGEVIKYSRGRRHKRVLFCSALDLHVYTGRLAAMLVKVREAQPPPPSAPAFMSPTETCTDAL